MNNFSKSGFVVPFTATRDLASGAGVKIGDMFVVSTGPVLSGARGEGVRTGIVGIAKATGN
ncbi:hypothetical protein DRH27_05795, partial [Candidatus Falkowbacteria bacterium]